MSNCNRTVFIVVTILMVAVYSKRISANHLLSDNDDDDDYLNGDGEPPVFNEEIPVELIQQYLNNVSYFFYKDEKDVTHKGSTQNPIATNGFGEDNDYHFRSLNVEKGVMAKCEPELKSVECHNDPYSIQHPSCVRVKRCGGCCHHNLLACQPTQSQNRRFEVSVRHYEGNNKFTKPKKRVIEVTEHIACKCGCKIQPADCNEMQIYESKKCVCQCKNIDDQQKCEKLPEKQFLWEPHTCQCKCRQFEECPSSSYFDENTCECVRARNISTSKRLAKPNNYSGYSRNRDKYFYTTKTNGSQHSQSI